MALPPDWNELSLTALYAELLSERATPQSTIEAIMWSVRDRGIAALHEPGNIKRLANCDAEARQQINERIKKLFPNAGALQ